MSGQPSLFPAKAGASHRASASNGHSQEERCEQRGEGNLARAVSGHLGINQDADRNQGTAVLLTLFLVLKERLMANDNNKNPNVKQPGENPDGKYHFNPGNMAGKKPGDAKETDENRGKAPEPKEKPAG